MSTAVRLGLSVLVVVACGAAIGYVILLSDPWFRNDPLRGRATITVSENVTYTKLGEPLKFETLVWISSEEHDRVSKLRGLPFDADDPRVRRDGASYYMRADLFRYYHDKGVLKNDP